MSATWMEQLRQHLRKRDGDWCWLCGEPFPNRRHKNVTLDHVIAKSAGGTRDPKNLRLAHKLCNQLRADAPAHEAQLVVRLVLFRLRFAIDWGVQAFAMKHGRPPVAGERVSIEARATREVVQERGRSLAARMEQRE